MSQSHVPPTLPTDPVTLNMLTTPHHASNVFLLRRWLSKPWSIRENHKYEFSFFFYQLYLSVENLFGETGLLKFSTV